MTENTNPPSTVTVTLDLTDPEARSFVLNALRSAANQAADRAATEGEIEDPDYDWADDQERLAKLGRTLTESVEQQINAARAASS